MYTFSKLIYNTKCAAIKTQKLHNVTLCAVWMQAHKKKKLHIKFTYKVEEKKIHDDKYIPGSKTNDLKV